jgi:lipid-binding SYLF domain-containing protein
MSSNHPNYYPTGTTTPIGAQTPVGGSTPPKQSGIDKLKHGGKAVFDKAWAGFEKLGAPVNKLTNKIGSEAFWPTSLDHESDKAARILKSFCSTSGFTILDDISADQITEDGFYKEEPVPKDAKGPKGKPKVLVKIPQKVIQNAVGLAIFTVMRTGLWISGAGGSGVLIARKEDGNWSPPSGILVHTLGVGFMAGIDVYDCVVVINTREALAAFSKVRVSLGGELSVVAGPVGAGGIVESEVLKNRKPVWSYMKSRGLYGGLQIDGTIIIERNDENAKFYGERLPISAILSGHVRRVPPETRMLDEVVKAAEGRPADPNIMQQADQQPPPGDVPIEKMNEPTHAQVNAYGPPADYANIQAYGTYAPPQAYGLDQKQGNADGYPQYSSHSSAGPSSYPTQQAGSSHIYQPPHRTDSGFAPPPGPPPARTDSGFPAPPGPPPQQDKHDPDGPPRYS